MIRAIIIEDEPIFQEILQKLLSSSGYAVQIDAVCRSIREARLALAARQPDLLFLDVELGDGKGIDLLADYDPLPFEVIFTTSHDKYALNAIKNNAADYLLKPIQEKELKKALDKVLKRMQEHKAVQYADQLEKYIEQQRSKQNQDAKMMVQSKDGATFLKISEIIRLESDSNYTHFILTGNRKMMVAKTLKEFEDKLAAYNFLRSHKSHLLNLYHIREIDGPNNEVLMSDGATVEISKRKKKEFTEMLARNENTVTS
jgi:two-component system LytT family response regulator